VLDGIAVSMTLISTNFEAHSLGGFSYQLLSHDFIAGEQHRISRYIAVGGDWLAARSVGRLQNHLRDGRHAEYNGTIS
jgi:hypothetical protein